VNYRNISNKYVHEICVFQHNADCQFVDNSDIDLYPKNFASDAMLLYRLLNIYCVCIIRYNLLGRKQFKYLKVGQMQRRVRIFICLRIIKQTIRIVTTDILVQNPSFTEMKFSLRHENIIKPPV
jgi:hypothetical protein